MTDDWFCSHGKHGRVRMSASGRGWWTAIIKNWTAIKRKKIYIHRWHGGTRKMIKDYSHIIYFQRCSSSYARGWLLIIDYWLLIIDEWLFAPCLLLEEFIKLRKLLIADYSRVHHAGHTDLHLRIPRLQALHTCIHLLEKVWIGDRLRSQAHIIYFQRCSSCKWMFYLIRALFYVMSPLQG